LRTFYLIILLACSSTSVAANSRATHTLPGLAFVTAEDARAKHPVLDLSHNPVGGVLDSAYDRLPGALFLRLHLRISTHDALSQVTLNVNDGLEQSVEIINLGQFKAGTHDFWTKMIPGEEYVIRVEGQPTPFAATLSVISVVSDAQQIQVQGYSPGGPWWEVVSQINNDPQLLQAAKSVARLQVQPMTGSGWSCTGFLIASDRLLTNNHCINSDEQCTGTVAAFDLTDVARPKQQLKCASLLAHDPGLDYALIQLTTDASTQSPILPFSTAQLKAGDPVEVIEHGWEVPARVSRSHCALVDIGVHVGQPKSDIEYTCDTIESSSGSPILNTKYEVLAIHHWQNPNQGVSIGIILEDLRKRKVLGSNP
jgi:hypothetical protein